MAAEMTYICACKLPSGLDLGGFTIKGISVGLDKHDRNQPNVPGQPPTREVLAGYEITRGVPALIWMRWYRDNVNGPIVQNSLVMGFPDEGNGLPIELQQFCVEHARVRGNRQAGQDGSTG
jgi:hypothetical protein